MHTITSCTPYVIETQTVSKEIVSWMSEEFTTLLNILPVISEEIRRTLLDTASNQIMLWDLAGEKALAHLGKILSTEERNQLIHALNGNILGCIRARNTTAWNGTIATGNMSNSIVKNDNNANKPALIRAKIHADPDDLWISLFPTSMWKKSRKLHGKNIKFDSPDGKG